MTDVMKNINSPKNMQRSKYRNTKIETEDGKFDSKREYKRWLELKHMQETGTIKYLRRQTKFELIPHQKIDGKVVELACNYVADFTYFCGGVFVVEDVKSKATRTPAYIIKRKLLLYRYGYRIKEV